MYGTGGFGCPPSLLFAFMDDSTWKVSFTNLSPIIQRSFCAAMYPESTYYDKYVEMALDFQQPIFLMVSTEIPMLKRSIAHPAVIPWDR